MAHSNGNASARAVILVTDPRQGLLLGRSQHAVLHNLDNQHQAEQSLGADLLIETSLLGEISHVGGSLSHVGFSDKEAHLIGVVGDESAHPKAETATNEDVRVQDQAFALHPQAVGCSR